MSGAFPEAAGIGLAVLFGLAIGSFLNVVIVRLPPLWLAEPEGHVSDSADRVGLWQVLRALSSPPSQCVACGAPVRAWQNLPVLSFILLRGRAGCCGAKLSHRYWMIEALAGVLCGLCAWRYGFSAAGLGAAFLLLVLLVAAAIDAERGIVLLDLSAMGLWAGLLFHALAPGGQPVQSVLGAALGFASLWLLGSLYRALRGRDGMGGGDLGIAGLIGAWLGIGAVPAVLAVAFAIGSAVGIGAMLLGRGGAQTPLPFVPFLAIGAAAVALAPEVFQALGAPVQAALNSALTVRVY